MPSKEIYEPLPEARGLIYDESEMALFHAKLSYHSTIESRLATKDSNLCQIVNSQACLIKCWEILKGREKEMAEKGQCLGPVEKNLLKQYQWRFQNLESAANQCA